MENKKKRERADWQGQGKSRKERRVLFPNQFLTSSSYPKQKIAQRKELKSFGLPLLENLDHLEP